MIKPKKLHFGTAGIPISCEGDTIDGIDTVKKIGLDAMELEFVRSINISKEKTSIVKQAKEKNDVLLTCHAPYYINLNSADATKQKASIQRILNSARIAHLFGCYSVCFHAGYYMKEDKTKTNEKIKKSIEEIVSVLKKEKIDMWIRPEISGKPSAFGSLEEIIELSSLEQVQPCIDFAHLHARTNGRNNTKEEFMNILGTIEKNLGKHALENMHIHMSGIEYTPKGERNHLILEKSDINYKELLKSLKEFNVKGVVISESPNIEKDALLMKKVYEEI